MNVLHIVVKPLSCIIPARLSLYWVTLFYTKWGWTVQKWSADLCFRRHKTNVAGCSLLSSSLWMEPADIKTDLRESMDTNRLPRILDKMVSFLFLWLWSWLDTISTIFFLFSRASMPILSPFITENTSYRLLDKMKLQLVPHQQLSYQDSIYNFHCSSENVQ